MAFSHDLKSKPLGIAVDDVPVVLWRAEGAVQALVDQCPHRSAKLSVGKVVEGGAIQCPFHAWRFGGDGVCRSIPLVTGAERPAKVRAGRLAAREAGGLIWLFTRVLEVDEAVPPMPSLPPSMTEPGWHGDMIVREWDAHWSRAIQTMLDVAHIPFVRARTIGAGLGRKIGKVDAAHLKLDLRETGGGAYEMDWGLTDPVTGGESDAGWLAFLPPNGMSPKVPVKGETKQGGARVPKEWYLHIFCTPTTEGRSNQFVVPRRNFGRGNPAWAAADKLNIVVLNEDKRNVETAWPSRVPAPTAEISMPADASTIAFQRYHWKTFVEPTLPPRGADAVEAAE
ncbi:Rieske 2Fe-2S domain-containing protein [Jannaschia aquimarina]|uniref:NdmA protein n=1 Tax=Jannaschia aquimarina TaxID=935700 RepID=A0A0D1EHA7_9RHOB|nr:Rieske 2Fe-2S domain-containing protein [Jannaschia aquimarina]KIT17059.1 Methylxanthine N1-demethylase NdmA [Jannaschia aquimarina]SNS82502.1 Rieske [2Fe-2S] domain-containing protein [Jannaschia aquimarina]